MLAGKKIWVTGASGGIGLAIVKTLLEKGATVVGQYHNSNTEISNLASSYSELHPLQSDLSESDAITSFIQKGLRQTDGLDTLILNAGVFQSHPIDLPLEKWIEIWEYTLKVNLTACGILTRLALEYFKKRGKGQLIYIGSRAAFRGETEEYLAYAASKGGLTSLCRSVARSYGKDGVAAFCIAPGFTETKMAQSFIDNHGREALENEIALNRLTRPEDIAPLVAFMCTGKMDHATGTTIDVNAGSYMH